MSSSAGIIQGFVPNRNLYKEPWLIQIVVPEVGYCCDRRIHIVLRRTVKVFGTFFFLLVHCAGTAMSAQSSMLCGNVED